MGEREGGRERWDIAGEEEEEGRQEGGSDDGSISGALPGVCFHV